MKTLVLCNGQPPAQELFTITLEWADYFIAADGGGNVARSFDATADIVVGDMDSYDPKQGNAPAVSHNPDQETNDLEKALHLAREEGTSEVIVLGATGKRLDHTLKNLSVLKRFNGYFERLIMRDEFNDAFLIPSTFTIDLPVGTTVSLFPLSGKVTGIQTQGLKYPLFNETLENGVRDGLSNEVTASPVKISYAQGALVIIVVRE